MSEDSSAEPVVKKQDTVPESAVKLRFSDPERYNTKDIRTVAVKSFLWGKMHEIRFPRVKGSEKAVFAWEPEGQVTRDDVRIFENEDEIVSYVSLYQPQILSKDTLKKAENATVWIVKPLILHDSRIGSAEFFRWGIAVPAVVAGGGSGSSSH